MDNNNVQQNLNVPGQPPINTMPSTPTKKLNNKIAVIIILAIIAGIVSWIALNRQSKNLESVAVQHKSQIATAPIVPAGAESEYPEILKKAIDVCGNDVRLVNFFHDLTTEINQYWFYSDTCEKQKQFVIVAYDGIRIRANLMLFSEINRSAKPFPLQDWKINSKQAIDIALKNGGQKFLDDNTGAVITNVQLSNFIGEDFNWKIDFFKGSPDPLKTKLFSIKINPTTGAVISPTNSASPNSLQNSKLYENSDYGFSMHYPSDFIFHNGYDGTIFDELTFRLYQGTIFSSFIYNGTKYSNTNLVGAGIAIGKITPSKEFGCKTVGLGEKTIGNLEFYHGVGATTLGPISTHYDYYYIQGNNGCYMIQMNTVTDENLTKPQLTEQDKNDLKNVMDEAALTFVFTKK